jgi:curli production assembly/transport component CsgF
MKKFLLLLMLIGYSGFCQQLTYKAVNPAFGGDTFNHQWLLNSANSQNSFKDPKANSRKNTSEIDRFTENLNRQLLGQVSRSFLTNRFKDGLKEGTFNFGSLSLEVYESEEGLVVNILDTNTGEQTQIIVPN